MPLSDAALREIAKVLRKHVAQRTLDEITAELVEIMVWLIEKAAAT